MIVKINNHIFSLPDYQCNYWYPVCSICGITTCFQGFVFNSLLKTSYGFVHFHGPTGKESLPACLNKNELDIKYIIE